MRAAEKGRQLSLTFGEGDDSLEFVIPPVDVATGTRLLATFLKIYTAASAQPIDDSVEMSRLALGEGNYERAQEMRSEEFTKLVRGAFYWNTFGGGMDALNAYLEGGEGKATGVVFQAAGVQLKPLSKTSPRTESETPTP